MGLDRLKAYKGKCLMNDYYGTDYFGDKNGSYKRRCYDEKEEVEHDVNVMEDGEYHEQETRNLELLELNDQNYEENMIEEHFVEEIEDDGVNVLDFDTEDSESEEEETIDEHQDLTPAGMTVENLSDKQLVALLGALQSRESSRGFGTRALLIDDLDEQDEVLKFWEIKKKEYTNVRVCNGCGATLRSSQKCDKNECRSKKSPVLTLTMLNLFDQLKAVVSANFESIMRLRHKLKYGIPACHNLESAYFSQLWKNEEGTIDLSLQLSVDGCCPHGNSKKKIWPICFSIVDIETAIRQKAVNIVLFGVMSGKENPSTHAFNTIVKYINNQLESMSEGIDVNGEKFTFSIVTCCADQPAKRSLFGFHGHNSEFSCFYCLDDGAFYKRRGYERCVMRKEEFLEDSRKGRFGNTGTIFAEILELLAPWDCVIDVLHNLSEGIITIIIIEMFPSKQKTKTTPKSKLFVLNEEEFTRVMKEVRANSIFKLIVDPRNGSEKLDFFRVHIFLAIIKYDCDPSTKLVIVGIALLVTKIATDCETGTFFYYDICNAHTSANIVVSK